MIDSIGGMTTTGAAPPTAALNGLDKDAFLKLLVAQLRFQNPMAPMDGQEYLAQAAQFAQVERLDHVAEAQAQLIAFQKVLLSTSLVGKHVTATDDGAPVEGVATAVRFKGTVPVLVVGDHELPFDAVEQLSAQP